MKSLDEIVANKIYEMLNYLLSKMIHPDIEIEKVTELDEDMIKKIKEEYGIEGIILDVDETLRRNMKSIPKCNEQWIERIKHQLKVIVVSNGIDKNVQNFFRLEGIEYIGFARKPLKRNFLKACEKMNLKPEQILVIGDSLIDDIYGGKRNNMKTALVKKVEEER